MPIRQYFVWVGSVLLLSLFAADWLLPAPPAHSHSAIAPSERANLRIRSDHKWPERVVFDTAHAAVPLAAASGPEPNAVHDDLPLTAQRSPREAFAAVEEAPATTPTATNENGPAIRAKPRRPRARMTSAAKTD
ncbi:hypothetical protein ACVIW2_008155 [Bradyrhizobium huanghuaihaiense]|uniref:Uncharacterized protein n=1 Tax=Bradyrhizobium huanghuaihaiense TaxID=990078 RepID=A0A562RHC1_9BRAD|nr:hypothetical protein [Bradyrhizobium huanghuaihaiense]TWI68461.1 hypothetical protein IQ16_04305 [Bradyrhizobium huanghuaihaiense]